MPMFQHLAVTLLSLAGGSPTMDQHPAGACAELSLIRPVYLGVQPIPQQESVYAPPEMLEGQTGSNQGALSLEIGARYMTDYIFRGLEVIEPSGSEDGFNFQFDAGLQMELGRLPDPFLRVFTNTAEGDEISKFQVIRPAAGLEWQTELLTIELGLQNFTYPDRDDLDTSEVFLDVQINDGVFLTEENPIIGPFIFAAYDIDQYDGFYLEGGVRRTFEVLDSDLSITVEGLVAYVDEYAAYSFIPTNDGTGFSHYQVGAMAQYNLNSLLNIAQRYGQWSAAGYLYYTDGIDDELGATTQVWGGGGIIFRY